MFENRLIFDDVMSVWNLWPFCTSVFENTYFTFFFRFQKTWLFAFF